jgi:predicted N-acyltransferase
VIHIVDLRKGYGALWSDDFSSGTRNKIRKAEKRGVEVQWGSGSELVQAHWDIYLRWTIRRARERGIPVSLGLALAKRRESLRRFEIVARHLGDRCQVWVASVDGQPAASTIVLLSGAYAHYWRSTSDQALAGPRYANYLLLARLLEYATERGHEYVERGESGGVRSLIDFKERLGARPFPYEELRFEPRIVTNAVRVRDRFLQDASDLSLKSAGLLKRSRARF